MRERHTDHFVQALTVSYRGLHLTNQTLVLAVSGGADSLALLFGTAACAEALGLTFSVLSIDHGLRRQSAVEVDTVGQHARTLGVPFDCVRLNLVDGAGMEARAREARYRAFETIRQQRSAGFVATAHTANDQAETLLMRLSRGAALRGARGILKKAANVVRPLLSQDRQSVESFLGRLNIGFVQDPHNDETRFFRTRVRQVALPALVTAAGHPATVKNLAAFAGLAEEDDAFLSALAEDALRRVAGAEGLDASAVRALALPIRRRVIAQWLKAHAVVVDMALLGRALDAIAAGNTATLNAGFELRAEGGWVRAVTSFPEPSFPGPSHLSASTSEDTFPGVVISASPPTSGVWVARSAVHPPLQSRRIQGGDRARLNNGRHRKLRDILVDAKVPREKRGQLQVVVDAQGDVVWVPGIWPREGRPLQLSCYLRIED